MPPDTDAPKPFKDQKAMVYVDYENIYYCLSKYYNKSVIETDLVGKLKTHLQQIGLKILDMVFFANYDSSPFYDSRHMTYLESQGVTPVHCCLLGKNVTDTQLTTTVLRTLYKENQVDVFVIISSDRDLLPTIRSINQEGKTTIHISLRINFVEAIPKFSDHHIFLDEILGIDQAQTNETTTPEATEKDVKAAMKIVALLFTSNIWKKYHQEKGEDINFTEYKRNLMKKTKLLPKEIDRLFQIAAGKEWITFYPFYRNGDEQTGIRQGEKEVAERKS